MSEEAAKRRLQRARRAARLILEQAGYNVSLSRGVLEAKRKSRGTAEIRRIMVFLARQDIPKSLPPDCEAWLKVGRSKFL